MVAVLPLPLFQTQEVPISQYHTPHVCKQPRVPAPFTRPKALHSRTALGRQPRALTMTWPSRPHRYHTQLVVHSWISRTSLPAATAPALAPPGPRSTGAGSGRRSAPRGPGARHPPGASGGSARPVLHPHLLPPKRGQAHDWVVRHTNGPVHWARRSVRKPPVCERRPKVVSSKAAHT